jgi:ABC-type multidrug transport system fused ATPase/permease subunit
LALQRSFSRLSAGRTVVVVTHRLRSIRDADRIAVVEHGRLVEFGNHDELMAKDGVYAYLYRLQYGE